VTREKEDKVMAEPPARRVPGLGPLESAIMTVIWEAGQPLTVRAARDRLDYRSGDGDDPAYTTVAAVMTNLWHKGLLKRARCLGEGNARAWWYQARVTREDHLAAIIGGALECAPDPTAVLRLVPPAAASRVSLPARLTDAGVRDEEGRCCGPAGTEVAAVPGAGHPARSSHSDPDPWRPGVGTDGRSDPGGSRAATAAVVAEFCRQLGVLTELRAARPMYEFWWEQRCPARPALVARRLPGASCQPHTVVTPDAAELRAILGIAGTCGHGPD
jgi:predicted transcriptional regulator